jgi:hypothetical protein
LLNNCGGDDGFAGSCRRNQADAPMSGGDLVGDARQRVELVGAKCRPGRAFLS